MKYFQTIWCSCHVPFEYFLNMGVSYSLSCLHLFSAEIRCESGQSRLHMGIFGIIFTGYFRHRWRRHQHPSSQSSCDESSSLLLRWMIVQEKQRTIPGTGPSWMKNIIYTNIVCGGFQLSKRYFSPCGNDAEFNFHYQFYCRSYLKQIRKYSR